MAVQLACCTITLENFREVSTMSMIRYGRQHGLPGVAARIEIPAQGQEPRYKPLEITGPHAAISVQERAEITAFLVAQWRFVQEAFDPVIIPDLVDHLFLVWSHVACPFYRLSAVEPDDNPSLEPAP